MEKSYSLLFDVLRFIAAILVFIHHSEQILDAEYLSAFASFGHDAVVFFFILSGFVIGYVVHEREKTLYLYTISRLVRIYSVAFPSLLIVLFLFILGSYLFPDYYYQYNDVNWAYTFFYSLFFMNQSNFINLGVPTNGPYWSICYEVWYYILFGIAFYLSGWRRGVLLVSAIFVAGIKVLVLFPIWVFGFYFYIFHKKILSNNILGYTFIALSIIIYSVLRFYNFDDYVYTLSAELLFGNEVVANSALGYSKRFLPDYFIAILVLMFISGLFMVSNVYFSYLLKYEGIIRKASSHSFSIYLLHYPLLIFLSMFVKSSLLAMVITLIVVFFISKFIENKKSSYKKLILSFRK